MLIIATLLLTHDWKRWYGKVSYPPEAPSCQSSILFQMHSVNKNVVTPPPPPFLLD